MSTESRKRPSNRAFFVSFLLVSLLIAGVVSYYASSHPDGLNFVAEKTGFIDQETSHASADSPLAGYSTKGVDNDRLSGGIAGVTGVVLMLLLSTGLFRVLRRRDESEGESSDEHTDEPAGSRG